jgi:hypothetical protein
MHRAIAGSPPQVDTDAPIAGGGVTWTKLPDTFPEREDLLEVSRSARLLLVEAMVWCNRHLLDGRITDNALRRCTDATDVDALRDELAAAGALRRTEDDRAWLMDWSDQELAEAVTGRREARAETQRRYRVRAERHRAGDHSLCDPRFCSRAVTGNATGHETDHGTVTRHPPDPTRPDPSRPVPEGQGQGQGQGDGPALAGASPADAAEASARLGCLPHMFDGDCCGLPEIHPIHRRAA